MTFISIGGAKLRPDLSGALIWDDERTVIVADLHFEKASSFARRGQPLPPYDTATTLRLLGEVFACAAPSRVICLGDSFHDRIAAQDMPGPYATLLRSLMAGRDWIWVTGNHDREIPAALGGTIAQDITVGPITFRHEASAASGPEISGHFHPKATVEARGRAVTRPCFIYDDRRVILPAFGAFTGGLNVSHRAIAAQFGPAFGVALLGRHKLHWFRSTALV
ncbi:MAG: ligase-associated DNA damage response endonuclease PdeM [Rhodospirillaceae bacterium]